MESVAEEFCVPGARRASIGAIGTKEVVRTLQPIWLTKTETTMRLRGRIERILDWATVSGYRQGDNPARWRGYLQHKLPKPGKKSVRIKHLAALPYKDMPAFMANGRSRRGSPQAR